MCMNCGCGEVDKRHHPTDITRADLQHAADGGGVSLHEAARNLQESSRSLASDSKGGAGDTGPWSNTERA